MVFQSDSDGHFLTQVLKKSAASTNLIYSLIGTTVTIALAIQTSHTPNLWWIISTTVITLASSLFFTLFFLKLRAEEKELNAQKSTIKKYQLQEAELEARNSKLCAQQVIAMREDSDIAQMVKHLVQEKGATIKDVTMIHYSSHCGVKMIGDLWLYTNANIKVYIVDPDQPREVVSEYQADRIRKMIEGFDNELPDVKRPDAFGTLELFTYRAPGSLRALLIHDHMAFVSSYFYQVRKPKHGKDFSLDPRSHDLPALALPAGTQTFELFSTAITDTVKNWVGENGVVGFKLENKFEKPRRPQQRAVGGH